MKITKRELKIKILQNGFESFADLARSLGIKKQYLSDIISGKVKFSRHHGKIAGAAGMRREELFDQ